jgi:hypothetical protein
MSGIQLDWRRGGYFFDSELGGVGSQEWQQWVRIFNHVKNGDFTSTPDLVNIFFATKNHLLRDACCRLLGDAGSTEAIRKVTMLLRARFEDLDPIGGDQALYLAAALGIHGQLLFVPEMLLLFEWNLGVSDSSIFALLLSQMLEMSWGPLSECPQSEEEFPEYQSKVMERARELAQGLGSEQAYVFMGQALDVPELARLLLRNLGSSHFEEASQWILRRRFEASTGINCTSFFKEARFQPLTAAVILEDFLSSDSAKLFVPGHKYFFGWPVP